MGSLFTLRTISEEERIENTRHAIDFYDRHKIWLFLITGGLLIAVVFVAQRSLEIVEFVLPAGMAPHVHSAFLVGATIGMSLSFIFHSLLHSVMHLICALKTERQLLAYHDELRRYRACHPKEDKSESGEPFRLPRFET